MKPYSTSASLKDYLAFLADLVSGRRFFSESGIADVRRRDTEAFISYSEKTRILDLANGHLRPQSTLLSAAGYDVVGIDFANTPSAGGLTPLLWKFARLLFQLRVKSSRDYKAPSYVSGSVEDLPFKDDSFDLITSIAAFEHFLDVPTVVRECSRVLRPGGILWCGIHVFTTISGGHNVGMRLQATNALPPSVEPWDHLRKRRLPFPVPLNEWRISQYLDEFQKYFEILDHRPGGCEGVDLLTPEIERELDGYTREELTCGSYIIVARKC